MVGLESSGASSGPSSPRDHHMDETHPPSSLSASPPSTSSECGSATSSRRPSLPEHMQDENYREKRKRNNDAAKRSREKRRKNDQAIEQRLLELAKENSMLKSQMNLLLETKPENQRATAVEPSPSASSVIVAGPSAPQLFPPPPPSMTTEQHSVNHELLYPLDLSQAAMAAAAAAAFKLPSCNGAGTIFSPQLLAAVAAANPLLQSTMPSMNNFIIYSHPPPSQTNTLRTTNFQNPSTTIPATPFMSARSAFHPVQRPSVVELGPSQPRATVTGQIIENGQQTSVIHHPSTPILREFSRPSVVQPPSIDFSKPSPTTSSLAHHGHGHHHNHHVHFVNNDIPLAQEPRSSIFSSTGKSNNNNNNSILRHGIDEMALLTSRTPTTITSISSIQQQPSASSSSTELVFPLNPPPSQNNNLQPSILGSLLSANRLSPTVPQSRTEKQSGLSNEKPSSEDLKTSLSNLAVHLNSNSICQSSSSTNSGLKSDTDSLASPQSTRSGSVEHSHSQNSPVEGECASGGDSGEKRRNKRSTPDLERYRDRRRRNNEAAKRCRANRRAAFEYRSKRSQQLENENSELRQEMFKLNNELEQLKAIIAANNRLLPTQ
uniref:BZIP domain-containing protein n=1 Tax=Panagrolaimus sp. ES5 TaxID=591445 RepID=A0AC34FIY1_9BILA